MIIGSNLHWHLLIPPHTKISEPSAAVSDGALAVPLEPGTDLHWRTSDSLCHRIRCTRFQCAGPCRDKARTVRAIFHSYGKFPFLPLVTGILRLSHSRCGL
jgi:hypothetical protein